jgi:hypothetical protein
LFISSFERKATDMTTETKTETLFYWLAINGASCSASGGITPLPDTLEVSPRPQILIGYTTREEQLERQQFFLHAPIEKVRKYTDALSAKARRKEIRLIYPKNPQKPTTGGTQWGLGKSATKKQIADLVNYANNKDGFVRVVSDLAKAELTPPILTADHLFDRSIEKYKEGMRTDSFIYEGIDLAGQCLVSTYIDAMFVVITTDYFQHLFLSEELEQGTKLKKAHQEQPSSYFSCEVKLPNPENN